MASTRKAISTTSWLAVIVLVAVVLRLLAALYLGNEVVALPGIHDQISYHTLATRVLGGHGFTFGETWWPITPAGEPTAHWSYLYTFYLVGVYKIFGVEPVVARLLQAILVGVLHPLLAYQLGRLVLSRRVGLIAAGLTAIYAYFIYYAAALMTESFYITGVLASLYLCILLTSRLDQRREIKMAAALGLALGATILLRQLFLLLVPVLLLWLWWVRLHSERPLRLRTMIVIGLLLGGMILPFTAYNYTRFDRLVLLNTNAGYAFFWSNHPIYGTHFEPILPDEMGNYQDLIPAELRGLDEAALDQALLRRGLEFITADPERYVRLSLSRVPAYFMFWPAGDSSLVSNMARVSSFGLLWPFMLAGLLVALFRERSAFSWRRPAFLLLIFALIYSGIHLLSWSLIRYRLPVDAILLIFAGYAISLLAERLPVPLSYRLAADYAQERKPEK